MFDESPAKPLLRGGAGGLQFPENFNLTLGGRRSVGAQIVPSFPQRRPPAQPGEAAASVWQLGVRRTNPVTSRVRSRTLSSNLNLWSPAQADAVSGCSRLDRRLVSRSGCATAMAMAPPTSIMTPHMKKPVLNPSSGIVALSITLPMI